MTPSTHGSPSKHISTAGDSSSKKRRREVACVRCHSNKIKCSGQRPCANCRNSTKEVECVYPIKDRKVTISEQYVVPDVLLHALERFTRYLHSLEEEVRSLKRSKVTATGNETCRTPDALTGSPQPASGGTIESVVTNPLLTERPQLIEAACISRPVYLGDASGIAFGMKVRQFMRRRDQPAPLHNQHRYFQSRTLLRMSDAEFELPEKSYAIILVKLLKRFLGATHHLNLESTFMTRVAGFYDNKIEDPVWICRLFFIFALGELYSNRTTSSDIDNEIPGTPFFLNAISLLQDLYEEGTVLYVETLILASLYSDALNRTNSAYVFIGLALRVSLTLGLHRNVSGPQVTTTEREHRHRVWWTVHYLERLCSSKLGHPMMLRDEDISTPLPSWDGLTESEVAEFPPPKILIAQLQLARIVGFISRDMYAVSRNKESSSFLHSVSGIFSRLKEWNQNLPESLKMSQQSQDSERPISSLHLLFNQCVILATRPVLFFVLQQHTHFVRTGGRERHTFNVPDTVSRLAESCVHAARTMNKLIVSLWINGSVAMFGYTDALFVFTSSMVLMISLTLRYSQVEDQEAIDNTWRLLGLMREYGNRAAAGFYEQLELFSHDLEVPTRIHTGKRDLQASTAEIFLNHLGDAHGRPGTVYTRSEKSNTLPYERAASELFEAGQDEHQMSNGRRQQHDVPTATAWQKLGDPSLSFYLQADSANIFQELQSHQQQPHSRAEGTVPAAKNPEDLGQHSLNNSLMYGLAAPTGGNRAAPVETGVFDSTWDFTQSLDMAELDDHAAWSVPWVWDELP